MDLYKFYRKSRKQQVEFVFTTGKNIAVRMDAKQRAELFLLDGLFAELCYNRVTNKLVRVQVFKDVNLLEPYLNKLICPLLQIKA